MFSITVLKSKDIFKFFIIIFIIITIIIIWKNIKKENTNVKITTIITKKISFFTDNNLLFCLDQVLPNIDKREDIKVKKIKTENIYEDILKIQISSIREVYNEDNNSNKTFDNIQETEGNNQDIKNENKKIEKAKTDVNTQVTTQNPIVENANRQYGNVKIKNQTTYELTDEMLNPDITIDNKDIILFHTHSCESYTPSEAYNYEQTGTFRTTDLNYSVVRVGTELENQLKEYNYNVIHNTSYHDYPSYNGSYTRSLATVENILKDNPSDIIIDVHRDAIGSRSDYAPTLKIGDTDEAAQIMFVIGTNEGGLWHPNWNQNLKFAVKVQQKAEEMYPGLFKPIMLTKSRYNQHTGKYASIIEVGATGNTLEQCLTSMKYLAKIFDEVLK
ncbi:MAG: stage II sporulation protein P [Clostridia bacterium]|nr:stage II sporulation protein P [Clostridia bacterium]